MNNKPEETITVIPSCLFSSKINFHSTLSFQKVLHVYAYVRMLHKNLVMTFVMFYHIIYSFILLLYIQLIKYVYCYQPFLFFPREIIYVLFITL